MDISIDSLRYDVIAVLSDGQRLRITPALTALGWEESEDELASRANISLFDTPYSGKLLSQWLALCTRIYIYADWGTGAWHEVFRGGIWKTTGVGFEGEAFALQAYDDTYYLQKSQASKFFSSGTGTQTVIEEIFGDWNIPMGEYKGPTVSHDKLVYRNKTLAAMIEDVLADAKKKGGEECVLRMVDGKMCVLPVNSNTEVYALSASNIDSLKHTQSMLNLVTRVVVLGKASDDSKQKIEATVDGDTSFGVIQQIVTRGDESLSEAKQAAQDILDEDGKPERRANVTALDLPFLRKGDKIVVNCGLVTGECNVKSVSHDADKRVMKLEVVRLADEKTSSESRPLLRYGDKGDSVRAMQNALIAKGHALPRFGVDGKFGTETLTAVKAFQRAKGLSVDGICGPKTWAALDA